MLSRQIVSCLLLSALAASLQWSMPDAVACTRAVYFGKEGQTVTSPFTVEMASEKLSVDTANGKVKDASGHYHILIGLDSTAAGLVVPKDSTHIHFGNAQTATELKLTPGKYKLTLQFADALHRSYGGKLATSVNVTVK